MIAICKSCGKKEDHRRKKNVRNVSLSTKRSGRPSILRNKRIIIKRLLSKGE